MLALILVAFTTISISRLSVNSNEQKARAKTTQALIQSRDAIMAYALAPSNPLITPPGILPCPDTNGDGRSNPVSPPCPVRSGLVPYITLNIPQPFDGSGSPIWYVVSAEYSVSTPHNSSNSSSLMLNTNQSMAFILLAPNKPIAGQARTRPRNPLSIDVAQFLEGDNADNTLNSYTNIRDDFDHDANIDTQNDQVLGVPVVEFWTAVEGQVLRTIKEQLINYAVKCSNTLPPAVPYTNPDDISVVGTQRGRIPLANWTAQCAAATPLPTWLSTNWSRMIYYTRCPTAAKCLQLVDLLGNVSGSANALVIGPGAPINGITARPIGSP
ncbi:MAG: hypothetical protein EOO68_21720, partial [Moraxellaceae bacterium]